MEDKTDICSLNNSDNNVAEWNKEIYSIVVKAGIRTYFFDVKLSKRNDFYLTITESKRKLLEDGSYTYEKHKIFIYSEDFDKILDKLVEIKKFTDDHNEYNPLNKTDIDIID